MGWARLDDGWHDHPKVIAAGIDAAGLWVICLTWAHANRRSSPTPGYVPRSVLTRFAGAKATRLAKRLVEVHLLDPAEGGWLVHDFVDYLPKYDPAKAAESGRKGAAKKWGRGRPSPPEDGEPDGEADGGSYGEPDGGWDGGLPSDAGTGNRSQIDHDEHGSRSDNGRRTSRPLTDSDSDISVPRTGDLQGPNRADGGLPPDRLADRSRTHGSRASARRNPVPVPVVHGDSLPPVTQVDDRDPNEEEERISPSADPLARLVADVRAIRPTWPARAVEDAALQAADRRSLPIERVRTALVAVAERADSTAPGRVLHDGPWWTEVTVPVPPPARERLAGRPDLDPDRNLARSAAIRAELAARKPAPDTDEES